MKKKIIRAAAAILVLTVALSFAFSGCSNKKDGGDETTTMPPEAGGAGADPQTAVFKRR